MLLKREKSLGESRPRIVQAVAVATIVEKSFVFIGGLTVSQSKFEKFIGGNELKGKLFLRK